MKKLLAMLACLASVGIAAAQVYGIPEIGSNSGAVQLIVLLVVALLVGAVLLKKK
jgi:hypothetical protein